MTFTCELCSALLSSRLLSLVSPGAQVIYITLPALGLFSQFVCCCGLVSGQEPPPPRSKPGRALVLFHVLLLLK